MKRVQHVSDIISEFNISSCVVTDDERIQSELESLNYPVKLVKDVTVSGTDRIKLAYERHFQDSSWDLIVNVQGDEPLIDPFDLANLIKFHLSSDFDITTLFNKIGYEEEVPNKVKIALNEGSGQCLYFSRS